MSQSKFYHFPSDYNIPGDCQIYQTYSNLQYHTMLNGYCGNVSLIKTPLKHGISSSHAYADNSMFGNGLSGILTLNLCIDL